MTGRQFEGLFSQSQLQNHMPKHPSHSDEQLDAEAEIIQKVSVQVGSDLRKKSLPVGSKQPIQIDGFSQNPPILCESYARIGELKPAQAQKVSADILKMLFAQEILGGDWRKILAFADQITAKPFLSDTWHRKVAEHFGIEVIVVQLDPATRKQILDAQKRQKMKNAEDTN
jgi:hypothetical protein